MQHLAEKVAKLEAKFNPDQTEMFIRRLPLVARNYPDEQAKRRLMPIVLDLIETVVISHMRAIIRYIFRFTATSPPILMGSLEVIEVLPLRLLAFARTDLISRIASGDLPCGDGHCV